MYAVPFDLLGSALAASPGRVRAVTARWRRTGLADTGADRPRSGLGVADPRRDAGDRPGVPGAAAVAGTAGPHPGRPGGAPGPLVVKILFLFMESDHLHR